MPSLRMLRGPEPGRIYTLEGDIITIGRGSKNAIVIHDNEVSREHCRLARVLDDYEIYDVGSTNGTFVNGKRIDESGWLLGSEHIVELGDTITLEYLTTDSTGTQTPVEDEVQRVYYLFIKTTSSGDTERYELEEETITIGRDIDNDIVVQEPEVSRHHMRLIRARGGYAVEDLGTLNGTHLNTQRIEQPVLLYPGDVVQIGTSVEMRYDSRSDSGSKPRDDRRSTIETAPLERATVPSRKPGAGDEVKVIGPGALEGHLLIAYVRPHWEPVVGPMLLYLQDNRIPVWVDQYLQLGSPSWRSAVQQAMEECSALLAVISPASLASEYMRSCLRHFISSGRPIVLMQYGESPVLPASLARLPLIVYDESDPNLTFENIHSQLLRLDIWSK